MKSVIKFGTDGWRALVAEEFTLPNVRAVAQGVAEYLKAHPARGRAKAVLVGFDTRPLGGLFAQAVAEVLAGNGIRVFLTDTPMPTPAISLAIRQMKLSGGIVVTASHNPFTYNGLKFKPFYAGPAESSMTQWIEKRLFKRPACVLPLEVGLAKGMIKPIDLKPGYLKFLRGYVRWNLIKQARFRVAYDSMYGAGQQLLEEVTSGSKLKILAVRHPADRVSSQFRPEPLGQHLNVLARFVRRQRCHLGIANDGDADRAGLVTPEGRFVSSQETMSLLLWHLLEDCGWRGLVVTTVAGSNLMDAICKHYGVPLKRTPVGFKHIARLMRTKPVLFGGEESGGFGFKGCPPERDGLLAGLLILQMMVMRKQNLSRILKTMRSRFGQWSYSRDDLILARPISIRALSQWSRKIRPGQNLGAGSPVARVDTQDGAKIILKDRSWLLLRPSGTEPLLRLYAEATSPAQVKALLTSAQRMGKEILRS